MKLFDYLRRNDRLKAGGEYELLCAYDNKRTCIYDRARGYAMMKDGIVCSSWHNVRTLEEFNKAAECTYKYNGNVILLKP